MTRSAHKSDGLLDEVTVLSHRFGGDEFVKGGGGNCSGKDAHTLWIKPSGLALSDLKPADLVALDRAKLAKLYSAKAPRNATAREALVKEIMLDAVAPGSSGRPSVESPLHDSFHATFVLHLHPPLVGGMVCAADGKAACQELFPNALWMDYTDPGFTLCMSIRHAVADYTKAHGRQPSLVFHANHGLFVAANSSEKVSTLCHEVLDVLRGRYRQAGVSMELGFGEPAPQADIDKAIAQMSEVLGPQAEHVCVEAPFAVAQGPLTPDHIVYMKSHTLTAQPTPAAIARFVKAHGYMPRVIRCPAGVFAIGTSPRNAQLAMDLAQDGALVEQLTAAFGGVQYMTAAAQDFIDNWEVEAYRRQVSS
ncbi:MAG: class II aldolase/adducin family protein [Planctomycetaceae bacterium]